MGRVVCNGPTCQKLENARFDAFFDPDAGAYNISGIARERSCQVLQMLQCDAV